MMFTVTALAILVVMILALAHASLTPAIYDRILAVNMFGTKTVLFLAVLGFMMGRPDFLDIALVYALINFIGVVAILRFVGQTLEETPDAVNAVVKANESQENH